MAHGEPQQIRCREYSIFIFNIPPDIDKFGICGVFRRAGIVSDVYIPPRRARGRFRFGFVRYWKHEDASKSIHMFNNTHLRGRKLSVSWAKHQKQRRPLHQYERKSLKVKQFWVRKEEHHQQKTRAQNACFSHGSQPTQQSLKGKVNVEFEEWLKRSLVCTTEEPRDLATLSSLIMSSFGQCTKISALSSYKFLLTFPTVEIMEDIMSNQEELMLWFHDVQRWSIIEFCDSRKTWIEIYGVPPHGWLRENFKNIAELWGKMLCLGRSVTQTDSFEVMSVLIVTDILQRIDQEIILTLADGGYRIWIKEGSPQAQAGSQFQPPQNKTARKIRGATSEAPGLEDVESVGSDKDDLAQSHLRQHFDVASEGLRKSISNEVNEGARSGKAESIKSSTRTKTACFNQNDFSVELPILPKQMKRHPLESPIQQNSIEEAPPGFERGTLKVLPSCVEAEGAPVDLFNMEVGPPLDVEPHSLLKQAQHQESNEQQPTIMDVGTRSRLGGLNECQQNEDARAEAHDNALVVGEVQRQLSSGSMSFPPGFETPYHHSMHSIETYSPTGVEVKAKMKLNSARQRGSRKNHIHCLGKRVTRSQAKKCNELTKRRSMRFKDDSGSEGEEVSPLESVSVNTTESMRKLAEDSLAMGELLGLKVVAHKENAIKRITQSLKSARVPKSNHKTN